MCSWMGVRLVWAMSNFIVFGCMVGTAVISLVSGREYLKGVEHVIGGNERIKTASLITYGVRFSLTAELTADTGGDQGLATGVLNLAIVIPQIIVSLGAGPWDALYGGGNIPVFALAASIIAFLTLPTLSSNSSYKSSGLHFG